ncbi:MAG: hypothetical protein OXT67_01075 [Zetaproteobacteria bacterium]|nr:hypothetical protein [Zetaproteobacteria bacterium]
MSACVATADDLLDHASDWYQGLANGHYSSQRAIARTFDVTQSTVCYALKLAQWPPEIRDFVRLHQDFFTTKQLLDASRLHPHDAESLRSYLQNLLPNHKKKENPVSIAPTLSMSPKVSAPDSTPTKEVKKLIPSGFFLHLYLGLCTLAITALGAWLTHKLYLDVAPTWRLHAAFAVLLVVGVILPLTAHNLPAEWQRLSWSAVAMGMVYSGCLVTFGNLHLSERKRIVTETAEARIALLEQSLSRLREQQQQWNAGYFDPKHDNYHKPHAAKKAEQLGEEMVELGGQITKLKLEAQGYNPWMIFVDVLRQLVVELALVLVVCRWSRMGVNPDSI